MSTAQERTAAWNAWAAENKQHLSAYRKQYFQENRGRAAEKQKARYHSDLDYKFRKNLSNRISKALRTQQSRKDGTIWDMLGCDAGELRAHLAALFEPGMSWSNHGEWHVDHIRPCASFDLTDPEQQRQCFHYKNLQPMWARENQSKGARL